jgi:hypothetical protein
VRPRSGRKPDLMLAGVLGVAQSASPPSPGLQL